MDKYQPTDGPESIRCSNLRIALLKWFYNRGNQRTMSREKAHMFDLRGLKPAEALGLLAFDGHVWYITEAGIAYIDKFDHHTPFNTNPSRTYNDFLNTLRVIGRRRHTASMTRRPRVQSIAS